MVVCQKGLGRRCGLSKEHGKKQKKVSNNSKEVVEVVWGLAVLPRWWFAWMAAVGVVVVGTVEDGA